ncbi:unnamed protein product [Dovyalis caffra]|uniref:Uncharacterized protein n=1 Tax=Dovyalis caffra TaxID=77055 RepID=A0AAV1RXJ0_9ROSI|nr:unnamed protein product [Dovyalis caffra]
MSCPTVPVFGLSLVTKLEFCGFKGKSNSNGGEHGLLKLFSFAFMVCEALGFSDEELDGVVSALRLVSKPKIPSQAPINNVSIKDSKIRRLARVQGGSRRLKRLKELEYVSSSPRKSHLKLALKRFIKAQPTSFSKTGVRVRRARIKQKGNQPQSWKPNPYWQTRDP